MKLFWPAIAGLGVFLGCGHGSDLPRANVSGKISYRGEPVADGMVVFVPINGTKGPLTRATITEGLYDTKTAGGVPIGSHRVEIEAYKKGGPTSKNRPPMMADAPVKQQYLPGQYNRQSTLEVTIDANGDGAHDLELK
jgi:hypothetical protein